MLHPTQRRQSILADLDGPETENLISSLSQKYNVSEMTIRRDLKHLEEQGLIRRTYGGAIRLPSSSVESLIMAREQRQKLFAEQKNQIARYAARTLVTDDDIILLGGGTTVASMIPYLKDRRHLTVLTNGLHTTYDLQHLNAPDVTIICAGGILRPISSTFVGPLAERSFREFHAKKLFLSATGITLEAGVTDPNIPETQVKRAMIDSASQIIMLMDSSKFGVKSLMTVLELEEIDILITDRKCPGEMIQQLEARGVDVRIAPTSYP